MSRAAIRAAALTCVSVLSGCGSDAGTAAGFDAAVPARDAASERVVPFDAGSESGPSPDGSVTVEAGPDAAADAALDSTVEAESASDAALDSGTDASPAQCTVPQSIEQQPALLSATGCVDMSDPTRPIGSLVPYTVISPLWSDGAKKHRFVALPPGGRIRVKDCEQQPGACDPGSGELTPEDEGHWQFPVGTVLVKTFVVDEQLIETRLFMRLTQSTYRGFSYEWNETGTEALLLENGKDRKLTSQTWHYPSRSECLQCHTEAAGRTLGPTTRQMDTDFTYAGGEENQLAHFSRLDLFEQAPAPLPPYPDPSLTTADSLNLRARAYLATNCSICHRPGGTLDDVDLRYSTPFADTDLCNQPVVRGTGDPELPQVRLVPAAPELSSLSFRMHDTGPYRMPKIGSSVVDLQGTRLIDSWIRTIADCP